MDLVDRLKCYEEMELNVRPIFAKFGVTNWQKFSTPLVNLSEVEVMALLMNWVTRVQFKGDIVKIRLRDTTDQEVYEVWMKKSKTGMRITKMKKCEHLKTKVLYAWTPTTTYNNLTRIRLKYSLARADRMNNA